jgi:crotonobetainyl-CoA:carnitine CoA-transferase CaiB-like acyl-CoA transferase
MKNTQPLPLTGFRVIDYSHFLAGPHMSRCLSAMGAEVIKVERPMDGDAGRASPTQVNGQSGYFMQQNMGKKGLCINLRDPRGLELMHKLTDSADVFVENYRPGALTKLGLGYEELSRRNEKLVYCSVSAYGHTGPDAHRAGFGLIAEAKSGAMSLIGVPGEPPPLFRMPIADMYAGMHGVSAICAALLGRVKSGRGQHIDIALYDCMVSMHDFAAQSYLLSGELPVQTGHDLPQSTVYGVFAARDGYLVIAAQMTDTWKALAKLIGGEAYAADTSLHSSEGRNAARDNILAKVRAWTNEQQGVAHCCAQLDAAGVPAAPVQTIDQVLSDPQTLARGMVVEQDHPTAGKVKLPNLPFRFSDCDTWPSGPAPLLGQHNAQIAASLGYSETAIEQLQRDGVLYSA